MDGYFDYYDAKSSTQGDRLRARLGISASSSAPTTTPSTSIYHHATTTLATVSGRSAAASQESSNFFSGLISLAYGVLMEVWNFIVPVVTWVFYIVLFGGTVCGLVWIHQYIPYTIIVWRGVRRLWTSFLWPLIAFCYALSIGLYEAVRYAPNFEQPYLRLRNNVRWFGNNFRKIVFIGVLCLWVYMLTPGIVRSFTNTAPLQYEFDKAHLLGFHVPDWVLDSFHRQKGLAIANSKSPIPFIGSEPTPGWFDRFRGTSEPTTSASEATPTDTFAAAYAPDDVFEQKPLRPSKTDHGKTTTVTSTTTVTEVERPAAPKTVTSFMKQAARKATTETKTVTRTHREIIANVTPTTMWYYTTVYAPERTITVYASVISDEATSGIAAAEKVTTYLEKTITVYANAADVVESGERSPAEAKTGALEQNKPVYANAISEGGLSERDAMETATSERQVKKVDGGKMTYCPHCRQRHCCEFVE